MTIPFNPYMDFDVAVGAGSVNGYSSFSMHGFSNNIDTITSHDLIPWADTYTFPPNTGDLMEVVSSSAGDTSAITVVGLDDDFREVTQTITLNGTTAVQLPTAMTRINFAFNSGNVDWVGSVTIRKTAAGQVYAVILPFYQELHQGVYTIPKGKTGVARGIVATIRRTAGTSTWVDGSVAIRQIVAGVSKVFRRPILFGLEKAGSSSAEFTNQYPIHFPGPVDIKISAITSDDDTTLVVRVPFLLYNNTEALS